MTRDEQDEICRAIAVSCMWGQGGIASVIIERLDEGELATEVSWREAYAAIQKRAVREHVGVITDDAELDRLMRRGYWLVNYDADGCSLFNPPPMNGLYKYVSKELSDKRKAEETRMRELFTRMAEAHSSSVTPL